ncbi:MAG: sulfatase-like hydrolase/transferase [bacterium]|nr:sulfatase-like hydrolase/transferase [bacterium]
MKKFTKIFTHTFTPVTLLVTLLAAPFFLFPSGGSELPPFAGEVKNYNLLIITIDTLRADSLGCYGSNQAQTPHIDELANAGVMFRNCYSPVPITLPAHSTIFTGQAPFVHNVRNNGSYVLNKDELTLAEIFQKSNYETFAAISTFVLTSRFGLNQGFDIYNDSLGSKQMFKRFDSEIPADRIYTKFNNWLEHNHHGNFFSWVHFYDPHHPYEPPGKYKETFKNNPYLGEIAYVDHYIGKIIADLEARNILKRTVLVIAGDHGEAFGEHKEFGHTIFGYQENLKVPLIFYAPGLLPDQKIIDRPVRLADIMPTVLDLFEMYIPGMIQGESLVPLMVTNRDDPSSSSKIIYFESMYGKENLNWAPLTGIISDNYKYISLPSPELYNIAKDPGEQNNIFLEKNRLAKTMDRKLRKYLITHSNSGKSKRLKLSSIDKKRLETLGYISSFSSLKGKVMDPKKGIDILYKIVKTNHLIKKGRLEEAELRLGKIKAENPGLKMIQYYDALTALYQEKKDPVRLETALKKAISDFPDIDPFKVSLAKLYFRSERIDEAEALCLRILQRDAFQTYANVTLARIYMKKGAFTKARPLYRKALELEPRNHHIRIEYCEILWSAGKKEEAETIIQRLMNNKTFINSPDTLGIKTRMGLILLKMEKHDQAIAFLLQMVSRGHKIAQVYNQLGQAYFKKGDFQKAIDAYNNALNLDQNSAFTLSSMGTLYLTLFRIKKDMRFHAKAVDYYSRAIDANPRMVTALNGLAAAYSFTGQRDKAIEWWEQVAIIEPGFTQVYFNLGITNLKMGNKKKALDYFYHCKKNYYLRLSETERRQLDRLIREAR